MTDPVIFRPEDPLARGINMLVALRPKALQFIDGGRYGHPFAGWRAQIARAIVRVADEVLSSRIDTASGDALRELCASEFNTIFPTAPTKAYGSVGLVRSLGPLAAGSIPRGFRWRRPADPSNPYVSKRDALYESVTDTVVVQAATTSTVKIRALDAGTGANTVSGSFGVGPNANDIVPLDALFDTNLAPASGLAAGGSDGITESVLKRAAKTFAVGQHAPVIGAILATALKAGAPRAAIYEHASSASTVVLANDISWAFSPDWSALIEQDIRNTVCGFGCRVVGSSAYNLFGRVECTVKLRKADYLIETTEIAAALDKAIRRYFDERPDWYTWRLAALRGVCARADRRILTCTTVVVRNAVDNSILPESGFVTNLPAGFIGPAPYHVYLSNNAVTPTFLAPT